MSLYVYVVWLFGYSELFRSGGERLSCVDYVTFFFFFMVIAILIESQVSAVCVIQPFGSTHSSGEFSLQCPTSENTNNT